MITRYKKLEALPTRNLNDYNKKENKLKISIAGAKHSMGGHTMNNGGVIINMLSYNHMSLDTNNNLLTIGSGALWEDALKFLAKKGKSIYNASI